jgi:uncharacterized protein
VKSVMKIICQIYRSPKEEGMYLYVKKEDALTKVPDELLRLFGKPQAAMVLLLTPEKKLARVNVNKVMEELNQQGFYLQMPPRTDEDAEMVKVRSYNSKLSSS